MHTFESGNLPGTSYTDETARGYLLRARAACQQGNTALGTHLYLAAADRATADATISQEDAVAGLKQAWLLAVGAKERSLAEHIFDKIEPFLTTAEMNACANKLQELTLLKLEEFGFSRQALEELGQLRGGDPLDPDDVPVVHVEQVHLPMPGLPIQEERAKEPLGQDLSKALLEGELEPQGAAPAAADQEAAPATAIEAVTESFVMGETAAGQPEDATDMSGAQVAIAPALEQGKDADQGEEPALAKGSELAVSPQEAAAEEGSEPAVAGEAAQAVKAVAAEGEPVAAAEAEPATTAEAESAGAPVTPNAQAEGFAFAQGGAPAEQAPPAPLTEEEQEEADRREIEAAIARAQQASALPGVGFMAPAFDQPVPSPDVPEDSNSLDGILAAMSSMMGQPVPQGADPALPNAGVTFPGATPLFPPVTGAATAALPAAQPQAGAAVPTAVQKETAAPAKHSDFTLDDLRGYQKTVQLVRSMGLGLGNDPEFQQLVQLLNARHGLEQAPAADTLLFRAPVREDALRFVEALVGEINLPSVRMRMDDGPSGHQTLTIMTRAGRRPRMNNAKTHFEAPAVLVVEDVDLWAVPSVDQRGEDQLANLMAAQISKGARDAIALIRSAVEDPDVYVVATAATAGQVDPFFCDLLTPVTIVDIENPTDEERLDIWNVIMEDHPSVRGISLEKLVELSRGLSREDIFLATREAIEESYRESLAMRTYLPVTAESLYAKLSAFFALDSKEYKALEEMLVEDFRAQLDGSVDDFLGLS